MQKIRFPKWVWAVPAVLVVVIAVVFANTGEQKGAFRFRRGSGISRSRSVAPPTSFAPTSVAPRFQPMPLFSPPPPPPPPVLPDLIVEFDSPTSIKITNNGGNTNNTFRTKVLYIITTGPNAGQYQEQFVTNNGINEKTWIKLNLNQNFANDAVQIYAYVDNDNSVQESNEDNNKRWLKELPDLSVNDIIAPLGLAQVGFQITNIANWFGFGGKDAGPFKVKVVTYGMNDIDNPVSTDYVNVPGLAANQDTGYLYVFPSGIYPGNDVSKVEVTVDPDNIVNELQEDNNSRSRTFNPTQDRCRMLQSWWQQGVLTPNLPGQGKYLHNYNEVKLCQVAPLNLPFVSENECKQYKMWVDQGTLSENLKGETSRWGACQFYYPGKF